MTRELLPPLFMQRFSVVPLQLFRIQNRKEVRLREYAAQEKLGRTSFDLMVQNDGLVHPMQGNKFVRPNGMSWRPLGPILYELLADFKGNCIYIMPKGLELPSTLTLIHEHSDHYSIQVCASAAVLLGHGARVASLCILPELTTMFPVLPLTVFPQTTKPVTLKELNDTLTSFVANLEMIDKKEFHRRFPYKPGE